MTIAHHVLGEPVNVMLPDPAAVEASIVDKRWPSIVKVVYLPPSAPHLFRGGSDQNRGQQHTHNASHSRSCVIPPGAQIVYMFRRTSRAKESHPPSQVVV